MTSNRLPPVLDDSVGPYFPTAYAQDFRHDLTRHVGMVVRPTGETIEIEGVIRDSAGNPVAPVLVEFWQADAQGQYRTPLNAGDDGLDPWFDGFGRQYSEDGVFRLTTIRPGSSKSSAGPRAPNITVTIYCDGISKLVTQIFFADEPLNETDPLLFQLPPDQAHRLIAVPDGHREGRALYRRDIVLRGKDETPFFDDVES